MRILVFFDLPTTSYVAQRDYTLFRRFLIKNGFIMLQESVYSKLALNNTVADLIKEKIKKNKPQDGIVQMLTITEKQFAKMDLLIGNIQTEIIDNDKKLVIL
ncbi:MAG: CRISPR-associated endonuclease Cas2 [Spirochaetales bacterium]